MIFQVLERCVRLATHRKCAIESLRVTRFEVFFESQFVDVRLFASGLVALKFLMIMMDRSMMVGQVILAHI